MNETEFCLAYECPLHEVSDDLLTVCSDLGFFCETCDHHCS